MARVQKHEATLRTLWGLAKSPELQMDGEELHLVVMAQTGKESMRSLTPKEIKRVAFVLGQMKESVKGKKRLNAPGNIGTENQRKKIYILAKELGWDNPARVNGLCRKMFRVDRIEWLDYMQCSDLIEALKAMIRRKENTGRT